MASITSQLFQAHLEMHPGQRLLTLSIAPELAVQWAARVEGQGGDLYRRHPAGTGRDLYRRHPADTGGDLYRRHPADTGRETGETWAIWDRLPEVQAAEHLAGPQRLQAFYPLHAADLSALAGPQFDLCVLDTEPYPNRAALLHLLWQAAEALAPSGMLYVAGPNDGGIQALEKRLRAAWGQVEIIAYKKGHRLLQAPRPASLPPLDEPVTGEQTITLRGQRLTLALRPGVFAGGGLDPATALLAEVMQVSQGQRVLDLGCGSGVLGMLAARLAPASRVTLVDASAAALAAAQENCRRNGLHQLQILASDGVAAVRAQQFDLVLCNPPFHQGHTQTSATALRFIREAREVLAPRGRLYLVANRFLRYEPAFQEAFGKVTRIREDARYKVLLAERPGA
jgi:16S rRNA (guanine1207-N2)-methyltransferase